MSLARKIARRTSQRAARVRKRFSVELPRISVFRSLNHIYAQIIDDKAQTTLVSYSSLELKNSTDDKKAIAYTVGKKLAERAIAHGIVSATFDRGSFRFHGRVKSLAEGVREGGLRM